MSDYDRMRCDNCQALTSNCRCANLIKPVDDSSRPAPESLSDDFEAAIAKAARESVEISDPQTIQEDIAIEGFEIGARFARHYTLTKDPVVLGLVEALKFSQTTIPPEAWWEKNEGTRVHKSAVKMREALAAFELAQQAVVGSVSPVEQNKHEKEFSDLGGTAERSSASEERRSRDERGRG